MAKRKTVSPRRAETRRRFIAAATDAVARDGFHGASVQDIAERAGFSVGALYSNFAGKDDLFLAVFDEHVTWFENRTTGAAETEDPAAAVADSIRLLAREPTQFLVFVEFWAYAVRKNALRKKLALRMARMHSTVERALDVHADRSGQRPALAPALIATIGIALARGLTLERVADPAAVSDQAIERLLQRLLA